MERTVEIPMERWGQYLTELAAQLRGHVVRVEIAGAELGAQPLTRGMQLSDIGWAQKGSDRGAIELELGGDGEIEHRIIHASHLYAREAADGTLWAIDIEDEEHTKTLLSFTHPQGGMRAPRSIGPRVGDYMTSRPEALERGSSVAQAYDVMRRRNVRHVPIMDRGHLVGVVSDRDLYLVKGGHGIDPDDITVDETMSREPYQVSSSTPLVEAAEVMAQRKIGCTIVVNAGQVVGILTTSDALRALVELCSDASQGLAEQSRH